MDSVTQIVLGAAVGELIMGRKIGNKAQLLGAIAGTLPDLDVLTTPFLKESIDQILIHRSYSHALPVHVLAALPFAWLCFKLFKGKHKFLDFYWLWFLGFATHALLDCCTTYGTQFFLPFTRYLVGFNNVSIIDPLYTLPFIALLIACLFMKRDSTGRRRTAWWALGISSIYMLATFGAKGIAHRKFESELKRQQIAYTHLSTSPSILNAVLWAGIAYTDSTIFIGDYSHAQQDDSIKFVSYPRNQYLLNQVSNKKIVNTLRWFSQDKYFVEQQSADTLNVFIVKWGSTDFTKSDAKRRFLFYNQVTKDKLGNWQSNAVEPRKDVDFKKALIQLWQRIWHRPLGY
jgi:inner membrane protein